MPDDTKVLLGVRVSAAVHQALKVLAAETGESMGDLTDEALRDLLARHGKRVRRKRGRE